MSVFSAISNRFSKSIRLYLSLNLLIFLGACSSASKLLGSFSGQTSPAGTEVAKSPNGGSTSGTNNDEMELPTIEVAGVNLTSECLDLGLSGRVAESNTVRCAIRSDSDVKAELKVEKVILKTTSGNPSYNAIGVSGLKGAAASTWQVSKSSSVDVEFDIPVSQIPAFEKHPAVVVLENVQVNGVPATSDPIFRPRIMDFFTPDPQCGNSVSLDFAIQIPMFTPASTDFTPDLNGIPNFSQPDGYETGVRWSRPPDSPIDAQSKICELQFIDDIEFSWTGDPGVSYSISGTVGSADNLMFTNVSNLEKAFGFPAIFMIGAMQPTGLDLKTRLTGVANQAITNPAVNWCPFGLKDCLGSDPNGQTTKIHLTKIAPAYLARYAHSILTSTGIDEGIKLRVQGYGGFLSYPTLLDPGGYGVPGIGSVRGTVKFVKPN
ncbi:MAG: hypothetical protein RI953_1634 [Pseudomonadota bacterium]